MWQILKGKFATNLKKHSQNKHKEESEDGDRSRESQGSKQYQNRNIEPSTFITITRNNRMYHQPTPRYYNTESSKHTAITSYFQWSHQCALLS